MANKPILYFEQSGRYDTEVVGESHYQEHLADLELFDHLEFDEAELWLEDYNPHDKNAVSVSIEGGTVGYLSRKDAIEYRQKIAELGYPVAIGVCNGKLTGGHILEDGKKASFGVVLDLNIDNLVIQEIKTIESWEPKVKEQTAIDKVLYGDKKANSINKFLSKYIHAKYPLFFVVAILLITILLCGTYTISTITSGIAGIHATRTARHQTPQSEITPNP